MAVKIRRATLKDVDSLFPMARALMDNNRNLSRGSKTTYEMLELDPKVGKLWRNWTKRKIASKNGMILIAEDEGKMVGYSFNYVKDNIKTYKLKKIGYAGDLYVLPAYRGKGIGSMFRKAAFEWFRSKQLKYASLAVHAYNKKARKIYEKWGFREFHAEMRIKIR